MRRLVGALVPRRACIPNWDQSGDESPHSKEVRAPNSREFYQDEFTRRHNAALIDWGKGDQAALEKLMPLVYSELRRLASNYLRRERAEHTLQPTALVNEAYLKLVHQKNAKWQNRAHFFGISAQLMRRILVDHARQHQAVKRGGSAQQRISITSVEKFAKQPEVDLLALNEALDELAKMDPQQSRIVELKFFGGLSIEEIAEVLSIGHATVERDWRLARAWLRRQLS